MSIEKQTPADLDGELGTQAKTDSAAPSAAYPAAYIDRSQWPVSRGTLTEMEQDEPDLSQTTTVAERLAMMWRLARDAWALRGEPVGEPPFSRHPGRLIRRER